MTTISLASTLHHSQIMALLEDCIDDLVRQGNDQWGDHYPTSDIITGDLETQTLYRAQNDRNQLQGFIVINPHQPPQWDGLIWKTPEPVMAVHRLCVHPHWQREGIAGLLMDFSEALVLGQGYASMRLDAYSGNPAALGFYEKRGYRRVGRVQFPQRSRHGYAFEKRLCD